MIATEPCDSLSLISQKCYRREANALFKSCVHQGERCYALSRLAIRQAETGLFSPAKSYMWDAWEHLHNALLICEEARQLIDNTNGDDSRDDSGQVAICFDVGQHAQEVSDAHSACKARLISIHHIL